MLRGLGATHVTVRTDSQLVARQASKEFATKEPQIARYAEMLEQQSKQFEHLSIEQIPQTENNSTNALARLASIWDGGQREIFVDSILHPTKDVLTITSSTLTPDGNDWQ